MNFNPALFLALFASFFILYHFVAVRRSARLWLIIAVSLVFYGSWSWRHVPVLVALGTVNFFMAPAIAGESDPRLKRRKLAAAVVLNAAPLIFFKFLGLHRTAGVPSLLVPVGMSFYTLQCVSYVVDVYRGSLRPCASFPEFMAALTFFPRLAAGPLVRWAEWLPQFETPRILEWDAVERGFLLCACGVVKMTVGALLAPVADGIFSYASPASTPAAWTGVLAFAGQIYAEFSGYTDIAIGTSLLLGMTLPENFNLPYLSVSPIDFWRRWHMSFYTWLYEYIYLPLVLKYRARIFECLIATVLFAGLWHGAKWTFILYGLYHGLLLSGAYWLSSRRALRGLDPRRSRPLRVALTAATFYFVLLGFAIFRADTVGQAWGVWLCLHGAGGSGSWSRDSRVILALSAAALVFCHGLDWTVQKSKALKNGWVLWPATALGLAFYVIFGASRPNFSYFH